MGASSYTPYEKSYRITEKGKKLYDEHFRKEGEVFGIMESVEKLLNKN